MRIDPGCQRELNGFHIKSRGFASRYEGGRHFAHLEKLHLYELKMHAAVARLELRSQGQIPPKSFWSLEKTPEQHNARLRKLIANMVIERAPLMRINFPTTVSRSSSSSSLPSISSSEDEGASEAKTGLYAEKDRLHYSTDIAGQLQSAITLDEERLKICEDVQKLARKTIRNLYRLRDPITAQGAVIEAIPTHTV